MVPALAVVGAYIGAALVLTSKGLSSIGGEFESVWILRRAPVDGHVVAVGKVATYALMMPAVAAVSIPLSLLAGLSARVTAIIIAASLSVGFLMTAVGI